MNPRRKVIAGTIALLACIALGISGYLTWVTWNSGEVLGCSASSAAGCDQVLESRWSKWFGLPVSLLGGMVYAAILAVVLSAASGRRAWASNLLLALALVAAGAGGWFVAVQATLLKSFCLYCMGVHSCGLIVGVLTILLLREPVGDPDMSHLRILLGVPHFNPNPELPNAADDSRGLRPALATGFAAVGLGALIGGQFAYRPDTMTFDTMANFEYSEPADSTEEEPEPSAVVNHSDETATPNDVEAEDLSWLDAPEPKPDSEAVLVSSPKSPPVSAADRKLTFRGLRHPIRMNECLVLGNPQAEVVIVEMMDYTCKHCRHLHAFIHAALERYGDKLAVVVAPTPLGSKCNPYVEKTSPDHKYSCDFARLATGLGFRSPELFADYHNWLMKTEEPQIIFDARIRAMDLSGAEVLTDQQLRARVNRYLSVNAEAQHEIGGGLPVMFTSEGVIRGIPKSQQEWFKFLEEKLGLAPVPATLGETASAGQGG